MTETMHMKPLLENKAKIDMESGSTEEVNPAAVM